MNRLFTLLLIFGSVGVVDSVLAAPIKLYLTLTTYKTPDTSFVNNSQVTSSYNVKVEANLQPIDSTQVRLNLRTPLIVKVLSHGAETTVMLKYLDIDVGPLNAGLMEYITKMSTGPHFYLFEQGGSRDAFLASSATGSLVEFVHERNDLPHIRVLDNHFGFDVSFDDLLRSKVMLPSTRISFTRVLDVRSGLVQIDSSSLSMDYSHLKGISPTDLFDKKNAVLLERLQKVRDLFFQMHPPILGKFTDGTGRKMIYIRNSKDPLDNVVPLTGNKCIDLMSISPNF